MHAEGSDEKKATTFERSTTIVHFDTRGVPGDIRTRFWVQKKWNIGRCCCGTPAFTVVASNILVRTQYDMSGDVQQLFGHHGHITAAIKELIRKHARSVKA